MYFIHMQNNSNWTQGVSCKTMLASFPSTTKVSMYQGIWKKVDKLIIITCKNYDFEHPSSYFYKSELVK